MTENNTNSLRDMTRRYFFQSAGLSIGSLALASLLGKNSHAVDPVASNPMAARAAHFAPKAKRII